MTFDPDHWSQVRVHLGLSEFLTLTVMSMCLCLITFGVNCQPNKPARVVPCVCRCEVKP